MALAEGCAGEKPCQRDQIIKRWLRSPPAFCNRAFMGVFKNIFTWWEGATFGTWINTKMRGTRVGEDSQGNVYFQGGQMPGGMTRRWVMYAGQNDTSRVPPEWHSWLHHTIDDVPDKSLPPPRRWQIEPTANLTGTAAAWRPAGALEAGGHRARASGDYQAWSPDQA